MNAEKVVIFLGTGASRALNPFAPLDKQLFGEMIGRLSGNWTDQTTKLEETRSKLNAFLREHYRGQGAQLWDALMLLDEEPPGDRISQEIRDILESQIFGVVSDISRKRRFSADYGTSYSRSVRFMTQLRDQAGWKVDFVTTNYDLVLDGNIQRHLNLWREDPEAEDNTPYGYNTMYALERAMAKVQLWHSQVPPRSDPSATHAILPPQANADRCSRLIKIHGSVNWAFCRVCNIPFLLHGFGAVEAMSHPWRLPQCHECGNQSLERMLVTPTEMLRNNGPISRNPAKGDLFRNLWGLSQTVLKEANLLVFIGYSMPSEDRHIRRWVAKANKAGNRTYKVLVITLDPAPDLSESYKSLFGDEVLIYPEGLNRFIDDRILTDDAQRGRWVVPLASGTAAPRARKALNA